MTPSPDKPGRYFPRRFHFVRHLAVFAIVGPSLLLAEFLFGGDWPLFWPLALWSSALMIHFFVAGAYDPDDDWIEERVFDVRSRSYDFEHIRNIDQRAKNREDSVTGHTVRDDKNR